MYGIQDKINQILRGAETIRKNQSMLTAQSDSVELYNALCKATHEVARLRELLNRAIQVAETLSRGGSRACRELHHPKKDRHEIGEVCPVEERLEKAASNLARLKAEARLAHEPVKSPTTNKNTHTEFNNKMNISIIPKKLEELLREMERGPIGMQEEARRIRLHLLTCPKCLAEMTNKSKYNENTCEDDK